MTEGREYGEGSFRLEDGIWDQGWENLNPHPRGGLHEVVWESQFRAEDDILIHWQDLL